MMGNFKKILFFLSLNERKKGALIVIMTLIMALLDMISVASILPFMSVITNPDIVTTNFYLNEIYQISSIFGVENNQEFLIALGFFIFLILVLSLIFKTLTTYLQVSFVQMRQYSIGKKLLESYLNQPYSWFLSRHSADFGKTILSEVAQLVSNGLNPLMEIFSKSVVAIALIILLILANVKIALLVSLSIGGSYTLIFLIIKIYLKQIGADRLRNNKLRFMAVNEAFGGIKEIKIGGLENFFVDLFSEPAKKFSKNISNSIIIGQLPRFILEALTFGGSLMLILFLIFQTGSFNESLPIISLFAFAGYRLMPALQQIYVCFTKLSFVDPSINKLYDDFQKLKKIDLNQNNENRDTLMLNESIILKNISYKFPNSSTEILKDINLEISSKSKIGIIGTTGSGKTTLLDIILGLLEVQNGNLKIDGKIIENFNIKAWQRSIGYVPQNIFLSDDTITENIAFGVKPINVNLEQIHKVAKVANIHEFIMNELPKQYQTTVGERGARLSGGQKQRIGIARALYHNPQLLILDESTSALDQLTEQKVVENISNFSKNMTIIFVAHRLNTLKNCNKIFKLENGCLVDQGSFNKVIL